MGWHADDEAEIDQRLRLPLSIGATRDFQLRNRSTPQHRTSLPLADGDLRDAPGLSEPMDAQCPATAQSEDPTHQPHLPFSELSSQQQPQAGAVTNGNVLQKTKPAARS